MAIFRMGELLQSQPDGFASSLGEGAFGKEEKLYRTAKGPISEGAAPKVTGGVKLPLSGGLASVCETERVFS